MRTSAFARSLAGALTAAILASSAAAEVILLPPLPELGDFPDIDLTGAYASSSSSQLTLGGIVTNPPEGETSPKTNSSPTSATVSTSTANMSGTVSTMSGSSSTFPIPWA